MTDTSGIDDLLSFIRDEILGGETPKNFADESYSTVKLGFTEQIQRLNALSVQLVGKPAMGIMHHPSDEQRIFLTLPDGSAVVVDIRPYSYEATTALIDEMENKK